MKRIALTCLLVVLLAAFEVQQLTLDAPRSDIGNQSIACHPETAPRITNGFATYFSDNTYACQRWNNKARTLTDCFVALNGVCGMKDSQYCDKCVNVINSNGGQEKCRVIDFCDPKNCDFLDPGHLDFLDNNQRSHYKFVDLGKNVVPYKGSGAQPAIQWHWTTC